MKRLCCALVVAAALTTGVARADVLVPPPKDCPPGTFASSCHGPGLCFPLVCQTDAHCGAGKACLPYQLCIKKVNCGGGYSPKYIDTAHFACPGGASCKSGTCTKVKVCLPRPPTPDAQPPKPDSKPAVDAKKPKVDVNKPAADSQQPGDSAVGGDSGGDAPERGCSCSTASPAAGPLACTLILLLWRRRQR